MMTRLRKCLEFLNNNISSLNPSTINLCALKLHEIEEICLQSLSKNDLGFYCSMLLQTDRSILAVLSKSASLQQQHKSTREKILKFLAKFLQRIGKFAETYLKSILRICTITFQKERYSKNKCKALEVVQQIISSQLILLNCVENIICFLLHKSTEAVHFIKEQIVRLKFDDESSNLIVLLIRTLTEELAKSSSSTTSTVRGSILHMFGLLARYRHLEVDQHAMRWLDIMLQGLKSEMSSASGGEVPVIEGCLNGLHGILFHFHSKISKDAESDIQKFSRIALNPQSDLKRYGVPVAAMKLLADHARLFASFLITDYKSYYEMLEKWFGHPNSQLKHSAHMAIEAFFKQIAITSDQGSSFHSKEMFLYFIDKFQRMIKSDVISSKEMAVAVQGYGLLASPCRRWLETDDVLFMCVEMITRCEHMFLRNEQLDSDKLHRLPTFISSIGNIIKQVSGGLSEASLQSVERLCILMIDNYPRLHSSFTYVCREAFITCMNGFISKPEQLKRLLFNIAYQGLIRSCSLDVVLGQDREQLLVGDDVINDREAEMLDDVMSDARTVTYSSYTWLWMFLLEEHDGSDELRRSFASYFIDAVIEMINKLNLVIIHDKNDGEKIHLSTLGSMRAENVADLKIFINLCDLIGDVFARMRRINHLTPHLHRFAQVLVENSSKFPLVSGFYKLLTGVVQVCEKAEYFTPRHEEHNSSDAALLFVERTEFIVLLQKFVVELSQRLKEFKDELLNSALIFLLSVPHQVVHDVTNSLTSSLKIACRVGADYLPVASAVLNAIQKWKVSQHVLVDILPHLETFLYYIKEPEFRETFSKSSKSRLKKLKLLDGESEMSRSKIRYDVMRLFGCLGDEERRKLTVGCSSDHRDVSLWDCDITIKYTIPFRDIKPALRLDLILWRVMSMARSSNNRKSKISACELLHSITLYLIGRNAQRENAKQSLEMSPLYDKLFPALFHLACDNDQVCREIFELLINQIIHWFTRNDQHTTSSVLLATIMDGLISSDNASLRDLCARSLREFLVWSLKQSSVKTAALIFARLCSLATHPAPVCRLGTATGFTLVYRVFRENDRLISDFTIALFVEFMDCLALSHYDDSLYGTGTLCTKVLSQLDRIIQTKHELLMASSSSRISAKSYAEELTLKGLVAWLFEQVGRPHTECRRHCIQYFNTFIKLLPYHYKSPITWIHNIIEEKGTQYVINRFESGCDGMGIASHPVPTSTNVDWLNLVLASLECYMWVIQEELLSAQQLFDGNNDVKLWESLNYFVREMAHSDPLNIDDVCSLQERNSFNGVRNELVLRLIQFMSFLFKASRKDTKLIQVIPLFMCEEGAFPALLASAMVAPSKLGFSSPLSSSELLKASTSAYEQLSSCPPSPYSQLLHNLLDQIKLHMTRYGPLDEALPVPLGGAQPSRLLINTDDVIGAYSCLHEVGLLDEILKDESLSKFGAKSFSRSIFDRVFDSVVVKEEKMVSARSMSVKIAAVGASLLSLALSIGVDAEYVVEKLVGNEPGTSARNTHASLFLAQYSTQIYQHMSRRVSDYVGLISSSSHLIIGMLEYLASHKVERRARAQVVCNCVLLEWSKEWSSAENPWKKRDFSSQFFLQQLESRITIMKKLFSLDASVFHVPSTAECAMLLEMYTMWLASTQLQLQFKIKLLDLLPFFSLAEELWGTVVGALEQMVASHFPLLSREFGCASSSFCVYSQALKKLVSAMESCASDKLVQLVAGVLCREEDHVMREEIQESMKRTVCRMSPPNQTNTLRTIYSMYRDSSRPINFRSRCVNHVIASIAPHCDVTAVVELYVGCISDVMEVVRSESGSQFEVFERCCSYRMMELLFTLLPEQHIQTSSPIASSYAKSHSQGSILKSFMKSASRDRNVQSNGGRVFRCCVYNAMIAAVICTQKDVAWYKAFLFDDNQKKNQQFIDDIIDPERIYHFPVEIDEPLKMKKTLVAIRMQRTQEESKSDVTYMSSVYASSLSEDVSAFDGNVGDFVEERVDVAQAPRSVELEADELNGHECMAAIVGLIKHMEANHVGFPSEHDDVKFPGFMSNMHRKLSSRDTSRNTRLFIAKLILNCASSFRRFASHWIVPLANLYLRGDLGSNEINCMVCDVMATILSWNSVAVPEDTLEGRTLVQGVLESLFRGVHLHNRSFTRHDVELIKTVLECWGRVKVGVDPSIVYNLCASDGQPSSRFAALQLLGALLSNGFAPYTSSYTLDRINYYKRLFELINDKRKELHESACEVAGMTLQYLNQVEGETDGEVHALVCSKLSSIQGSDVLITCLHKVAVHHPPVVDKFAGKLFYLLPKLHGEFLYLALDTLSRRAPNLPDLFRELRSKNFASMLDLRDHDIELVCTRLCGQLVRHAVSNLSPDEVHSIMTYCLPPIMDRLTNHLNPICRQELLDVTAQIYDYENGLAEDVRSTEMLQRSKLVLMKLLSDEEEVVRIQAMNFWNSHLPEEPCDKLHIILSALYQSNHDEEAFISGIVMLVLQSSSLSPDYSLPIFEHPLSKCMFQEREIDSSWRSRHPATSPMFVDDSFSKQIQLVKATQENVQFSETLTGRNTYNWMTGNSVDTFSDLPVSESKNMLMVKRAPKQLQSIFAFLKKKSQSSGLSTSEEEATGSTGVDVDVARLRRRFIKESSVYKYAHIQEQRKRKQKRLRDDRKRKLENEVQLHRKYREGELPDIEIPNCAMVAPLAAACQHDAMLSPMFASLFISSLVDASSNRSEVGTQLLEDLIGILSKSEQKSSMLVGLIGEVCFYNLPLAQIAPSSISGACLAAGKEELGIALIEQLLMSVEDAEPSNKRRRTDASVDAWFELARLYKSVGDYDVIEGIMWNRGSGGVTSKALKLEALGSVNEARKVYDKALSEEEDASEVEKDLWEDCLINCLQHLCSWKQLDRMCLDSLASFQDSPADLTAAWDFPIYVDRYLDVALHSKLILFLQGDVDVGNQLASFIDDSMKRKVDVEMRCFEHLCMLCIHQEDYDRAKYYLHQSMDAISMQWSSGGDKEQLLHAMSRCADVEDFLSTVQHQDRLSAASQLVSKWQGCSDVTVCSPLMSSYHHVMHRIFLLRQLSIISPPLTTSTCPCAVKMRLRLIEVASFQKNFSAAKKILFCLEEMYGEIEPDDGLCVDLAHQTASYYHAQAKHCSTMTGPSSGNLNHLLAAHQELVGQNDVINRLDRKSTSAKHVLLLATTYRLLVQHAQYVTDDVMQRLDVTPGSGSGGSDIAGSLHKIALSRYKQACDLVEGVDEASKLSSKIYSEMIDFCRFKLNQERDQDSLDVATLLCKYVSLAMRLDASASYKLPYLLLLLDEFFELRETFSQHMDSLPTWMFLSWVGHIVALLDKEVAPAVQPLMMKLCNTYPQAVIYPFTTALPGYNFAPHQHKHKQFVKMLKQKLHEQVPSARDFIKHLRFVTDPALMFKDWFSDFRSFINDKSKQRASFSDVISDYQVMYNDLFEPVDGAGGKLLRSKFAERFRTRVDKLFGGSIGSKISLKGGINPAIDALLIDVKTFNERSSSLCEYSPWLANYRPLLHGKKDLEVPGQYHGRSCPHVEYHATIVGFDDKVVMMSSMRRPCRVTMRGSDEREHRFLIKGGEDLRQDQRIQSIFTCINDMSGQELVTYQVVPISAKVGMLEWLDHVTTYWDVIDRQAQRMNWNVLKPGIAPVDFASFVCQDKLVNVDWCAGIKDANDKRRYGSLMSDCSYTQVVNNFNKVKQSIPPHILRNAYLHLASSPESFVKLRKRFVTSYAHMCICHWILGIGDRHATNFVIDNTTGTSVGIDFGHAFGSATEMLAIPELVPFRLTNQIAGLLSPHPICRGEMRQVMVRSLSELRSRSHELLPILDVFIKDPSVDWMKFARSSRDRDHGAASSDIIMDYCRRKVEGVKRKLSGEKPHVITCDELQHNRLIGPYRKYYMAVVKGSKDDIYRRTADDVDVLDVALQVDCLMEQSSDPNILGRAWVGWKSWC